MYMKKLALIIFLNIRRVKLGRHVLQKLASSKIFVTEIKSFIV
jgi:hypothetical protein